MKIISLIGARPQFIKEAIICEELQKMDIEEIIVNSGQHYDFNMSDVFFHNLNIKKPDYNLNIGSGKHGEMTGKIMIEFEKVVEKEKPDWILIYGDTNTTLAGGIVGAKMKINVAHIEAGVRMEPRDMPEEINRVLVDRISNLMFCPSQVSVNNLKKEGITNGVHFVGDVMYDLYLKMENKISYDIFCHLNLKENEYILVTLHRDYNVDHSVKLKKILDQLKKINKKIKIVFPVHPRTKKNIDTFKLDNLLNDIVIIDPIDYLNLMGLIKKSYMIITDSGGLQKEAYFAGKSAVVLMPDTGWIELINNGSNILCNENNLFDTVFSKIKFKYKSGIYGKGNAGEKIVEIINSESN